MTRRIGQLLETNGDLNLKNVNLGVWKPSLLYS